MKNKSYISSTLVMLCVAVVIMMGLAGCVSETTPIDQDPRLQLAPVPSDGWKANDSTRNNMTMVFGIILLGAIIYAIRDWIKTKKPGMICLIAGAGLTCLIEPFEDMPAAVWYMRSEQFMLFEYFGRPCPSLCPCCI